MAELGILKYSKDQEIKKNKQLKVKIEHINKANQIDKIKLEEYKPSLRKTYNQQKEMLDIYQRGQLWNKYVKTEKRGKEQTKPKPFWDISPITYFE